jgi:hypothetical protein
MSQPEFDAKKMAQMYMNQLSPNMMAMLLTFVLIFFIVLYVYYIVKKQESNCKLIDQYPPQTMKELSREILDKKLNKTFVKTAYNCCCTGDFKNDYVDTCALLNCAKQGVRALDFTIYSLNGHPVIAASTLPSKKYKEMYNSLPFSKTMTQVKQMFLYDSVNCTNLTDPLFLIFRIQSANLNIYNKMGETLTSVFGDGNAGGNKLYVPKNGNSLDTALISELKGKVIVMVDITGVTGLENSKLFPVTALKLGTMTNQIYRESDAYDLLETGNHSYDRIHVLYPDYQAKSINYDFNTVGLNQRFQFIGMNFQMKDIYLDGYNNYFRSSIVSQPA